MRPVILVVLTLAAAGCASPDPAPVAPSPWSTSPEATISVEERGDDRPQPGARGHDAPHWRAGDWWRWRIEASGSPAFEATTVVVHAGASEHVVGFEERESGLRALAHHVVVAGRVDAATLAWSMHDEPARVLAFPLSDGATWEGTFEGVTLAFAARATRAASPEGEVDAYEIVGTEEDALRIRLVYAPVLRSVLELAVFYGGEAPFATATLVGLGVGASRAVTIDLHDAALGFSALPPPPHVFLPQPPIEFEVPAEATHVVVACFAGGEGVQRAVATGPSGEHAPCARDAAQGDPEPFSMGIAPAAAGTWRLAIQAAGGWIEAEVYSARIEEAGVGSDGPRSPLRARL